mgnify:CR=1 FL=1
MTEEFDRGLHEECGVFGVYNIPDASSIIYYGLHSLQHRGQEGCGIVTVNDEGEHLKAKGLGLVSEVLNPEKLADLKGSMGIGHVRYSTHGGGGLDNVQPFFFRHKSGNFALAHNGNIVNSVNYPACSLGPCNKPGRIAICHKNVANMIGTFTGILGAAKVNIDAIANKSRGDFAYTLIDTDTAIPADVVKALESSAAVIRVRVIK